MNKNDRDLLPIGTLLRNGTYRVERYLGSGGFGKTYLVRHQGLDAEMVVKEFFMKGINMRGEGNTVTVSVPDNRATFESQRAKFKKEAQRLWKLKGDHIVGVHDIFEENGTVYYVMDFIDGESLEDRLNREKAPLPENEVTDILDQLLDALATIHHHQPQPIFHLDIKPNNILVGRDGKVVLIDFGASKQLSGTREGVTSTLITYTKGYAPSEQVDGKLEHIGAWTDLYAVGATLYRLLTTQQPPEPSDIINEGEEAFLFPGDVSSRIRDLIVWMMQPNRKQRPQTVEDVHAFLAKGPENTDSSQKSKRGKEEEERASHKTENRKEHAFAPRTSTNLMFIEYWAESYVGQRIINGSFVTCICLKKNKHFTTSNNIFITEKGCYLVTLPSREYQHFLTTIKALKLRVLEKTVRTNEANTGDAPAKLRITLYDEKNELSDELWLDGINNGNIVGDIRTIKERIVKVVSGLESFLNGSDYVIPDIGKTDYLEEILRFLGNKPQPEESISFVDGVPILYDDNYWGEYVIETGESEYGTSGLLKREVKGHIPIPDSIIISLTPNAGYSELSYEIVLKQKGKGKVLIAQNEGHAETVITGIPDDVMDYFIRNGFFSPVHWEIESKTSAPGIYRVSCNFRYLDGTHYLRSCNTTWNHVLLLDLIQTLLKNTSLSKLIDATIKLIHPIDDDSDSNDTIPIEEKYRLPIGYILKAHGRKFRIVGFIAENDYSITYQAIELHEETQFNTGGCDTVPLQQFTIVEYFCWARDRRLEDGITSNNNGNWGGQEHDLFLDDIIHRTKLPLHQVVEFYGEEYGLSWQFVKANGTYYYINEVEQEHKKTTEKPWKYTFPWKKGLMALCAVIVLLGLFFIIQNINENNQIRKIQAEALAEEQAYNELDSLMRFADDTDTDTLTSYLNAFIARYPNSPHTDDVRARLQELQEGYKTFTVSDVSFKMIRVEGGTFTMGATPEQGSDADDDEKPAHQVTLSSYYIAETEVTQELWQAVMGSNPSYFKGANRPVERVSWDDCQTFIKKLNSLTGKTFRLPTEAEWEYAARGGNKSQGYKYRGSNTLGNVAWYQDNSGNKTHPVKTKSPNELGIYDMTGNVWEWCQDWYGSYSSSSQTNPTGPTSGSDRVDRGGSWSSIAWDCRVSLRDFDEPDHWGSLLGLRLVL